MHLDCKSCAVAEGRLVPAGGELLRTQYFNISHDAEFLIPGFLVLASNRHFKCIDEMTTQEIREWGELMVRAREAQRVALGIKEVYYFYNEDTRHHFHMWMIPRLEWMKEFGRSIESVYPSLAWSKVNPAIELQRGLVTSCATKLAEALKV